ncbi:adenosine deaminase [Escherichia coli]|uniref:adenosine deaminase n=1 Tax=Escherichia coli TaxID=562 RepID=UPI0022277FF3|nr:adenosine deaminase [Escherichia coli]MCW3431566.1 adenosine deaminase [Escherichia coli]MCW7160459.1 adenosine deaminase [Escherichia coli]MCW7398155.1 adenosine deaminase [Escherichia coli]
MIDTTLPLTDIHRHLDGNIRPQTILELGRQYNISLPAQSLETLIPHVQVIANEPDLVSFLTKLDWGVKVLASLDACRRVAFENIEDAARHGLHYVELRFSPGYMAMAHQLPVAGVVEAVIDGVREGCRTFGVQAKPIGIMSRTFGEAACQQELEAFLAHRDQITALDLAGDELGFPGSLFLSHFNRARDAGWHITVHAGEAAGPESIWQAIRELGAERIGHGVKAIEDRALMDFLAEQQIGIESCLTSNIQTSTVAELAAHPLKTFLEHGIRASINTDDPGVQGVDIIHEYTVAAPAAGLSREQIRQAQINGLEMAFLSAEEKRALREKVAAK